MPAARPEPAPSLEVRIPRLVQDDVLLFEELALTLPGGRWTCLLGPSGVGKTTLLRCLTGALEGAAIDAEDGRGLDGRIALMAQQDLLLPWLDVLDNVLLGYRLRRALAPAHRERAKALLQRVGLGEDADKLPAQLSGGMRQRVALARTLMEDRPVVLMDEPFSALDAINRLKLQDMAAELLEGRTVLLVTHSPLEALRLGHRLLLMHGRPAQLREVAAPKAPPPRHAADPALLHLQGQLLEELAAVADDAEAARALLCVA